MTPEPKINARGHILNESPVTLHGGEWVRRGLIRVWVPRDEPEVEEVEDHPLNVHTLRRGDLIACPTCKARLSEPCLRANGERAGNPHRTRLAPRSCPCGGWLPPTGERLCLSCREVVHPSTVERLLAGDRIESTRAEKVEAMRRWLANGGSQRELCRIHGWAENRYVTKREAA